MASEQLTNAVKAETSRFLGQYACVWERVRERAAEELGPVLASMIRQEVLSQLGEPQPDARIDRVKKAASEVCEWWGKDIKRAGGYDDYPEELMGELFQAAANLPDKLPPRLTFELDLNKLAGENLDKIAPMIQACRVALTTFIGLQDTQPDLAPALQYPVDLLSRALGGQSRGS